MKKLILLCFIASSLTAFSQKKSYTVNIEKFEVLDSLNFNINNIIDNRPYKDNIGMAQKGAFNKRVIAVLPDNLDTYLQPVINKMVTKKPQKKSFDIIVHDLAVSEYTGALKETGYCKLQLEFVKDSLSFGIYNAMVQNNGMDVTKGHGKRIVKAFSECFKDFNKLGLQKKGEFYSSKERLSYKFPEKLSKGTYISFIDVLRNKPDSLNNFTLKKVGSNKLEQYVLKNAENKTFKKRKLLYSDGVNIYLHSSNYGFDNHYVKAKHVGRYIYFEDRYTDPAMATGMAVAFGVVGVLASNVKHGIILDTQTGITTVLNPKTMEDLLKDQPELYAKYKKSKKNLLMKEIVIIELNKHNS